VLEEVYKRVYAVVVEEHIIRNDRRNKIIVDKVCGEYKGKQVLIVVDRLEHGKRLGDMIWEHEKENMDFIHGQSESRKGSLLSFKEGGMRVLISSSIIDEGIDISRIETLVLASGKKSRRQILQRIGRGLRRKAGENKVTILDFFDKDGVVDEAGKYIPKFLEKHSNERIKIYNRERFNVSVVEP
jgi:superfamily II DNA or RNA helicase